MYFAPDILVSSRDPHDIALVVEVTLHENALDQAEQQLKRYMFGMRCPLGMLVTPGRMRLYRDTYTSYSADSIALIGEYPLNGILDEVLARAPQRESLSEAALQDAVQGWLERLARGADLTRLPPELQKALEEDVLPALAQGEIRAAGPRVRPRS